MFTANVGINFISKIFHLPVTYYMFIILKVLAKEL